MYAMASMPHLGCLNLLTDSQLLQYTPTPFSRMIGGGHKRLEQLGVEVVSLLYLS